MNKRYRCLTSLLVALLFVSSLLTRCASIGSPEGGPIDTLAPTIAKISPENFSTNMDTLTRKIYIEFNEFVKLVDQSKNFFTSPAMKNKPQIQLRGRGIVITLRDTLKPNTTYALNFGGAIQDNNEGNPLNSMRYVFSTGNEIDSMIVSGYTEDSFKADSVSGSHILFFPKDSIEMRSDYDSTLFNATPAVIARAESNGIFLAQNLKPIDYYIYALEDTNGNLTYDPGSDRVGFIDGTYNPATLPEFAIWYDSVRRYVVAEPQIHFRMFTEEPFKRQLLANNERPLQHKAVLSFGAAHPRIDSIIFDSIPSEQLIIEPLTAGRDTLALWFDRDAALLPDTIKGRVVYFKHDSLNKLVSYTEPLKLAWKAFETKEQEQAREKLERDRKRAEERGEEWVEPEVENPFKIKISPSNEINPERELTIDFDYPLRTIDTAAITLTFRPEQEEETKRAKSRAEMAAAAAAPKVEEAKKELPTEIEHFTITRDTQNLRRYYLRSKWRETNGEYNLTIPAATFTNIAGESNDSLSKNYRVILKEKFATLVVKLTGDEAHPSKYILELMDGDGKRVIERRTSLDPGTITFNYIPAGDVSLRILQDINDNGKWDGGNLVHRTQSERSAYFEAEGVRKITTKINWEIEISVDAAKLFAPESQQDLVKRLEEAELQRIRNAKKQSAKTN